MRRASQSKRIDGKKKLYFFYRKYIMRSFFFHFFAKLLSTHTHTKKSSKDEMHKIKIFPTGERSQEGEKERKRARTLRRIIRCNTLQSADNILSNNLATLIGHKYIFVHCCSLCSFASSHSLRPSHFELHFILHFRSECAHTDTDTCTHRVESQ